MLRFLAIVTLACALTSTLSQETPIVESTLQVVSEAHVAELGEGPYYSESERALYYVDATAGEYCRVDTLTGQVQRRTNNNVLVSIIIPYANDPGFFITSRRNDLLRLNFATGATTVLATLSPELEGRERFNDAKCDRQGRFFIGSVMEDANGGPIAGLGSLYRLDGNSFVKVATGFTLSNGMAFSNNQTELYFNDSEGRKVYIFDYNPSTGELSNQRVLIDVATHPDFVDDEYPDGMAIDYYGYIWIAMWNGGRVVKVNPRTARVEDQIVTVGNKIPTSIAFGEYKGKFGLYMTTASIGIPENQRINDGKVMHIDFNGGDAPAYKS